MKIKEKLKQFGILVIRTIWPSRARKSAQHLGILILGLAVMFGVSQASSVQNAIAGIIGGDTVEPQQNIATKTSSVRTDDTKNRSETTAEPSTLGGAADIVDLIGDSEVIVKGMVKDVTDGFENGVPYTEVTIQVNEALRGQVGNEYTFRQFGLKEPRKLENGKTYLGITPEGWSKYKEGENAVFFLCNAASMTGLRTTVGLGQGKVLLENGNATSQFGNQGLFENVDVDARLLNDKDKRLLATKKGAVNADGFMSFVRRALKGKWVEGGRLRHANK
jgi:hypothetical protein